MVIVMMVMQDPAIKSISLCFFHQVVRPVIYQKSQANNTARLSTLFSIIIRKWRKMGHGETPIIGFLPVVALLIFPILSFYNFFFFLLFCLYFSTKQQFGTACVCLAAVCS